MGSSSRLSIDNLSAGSVDIALSSGDATINDISSLEKLNIKTSSGVIETKGVKSDSFRMVSSGGNMALNNAVVASNIILESSSGIKIMTNCSMKNLTIKSSSGNNFLTNVDILGNFNLSSSSGVLRASDIHIHGTSTHIESTSGYVNIKLIGSAQDYTIKAQTSSGDIIVDDGSNNIIRTRDDFEHGAGAKVINLETSSGVVNIRIN